MNTIASADPVMLAMGALGVLFAVALLTFPLRDHKEGRLTWKSWTLPTLAAALAITALVTA